MTAEILELIRLAKSNHNVSQLADALVAGLETADKGIHDHITQALADCHDRIRWLEDKIAKLQNPQPPVDTLTESFPFAQKAPAPLAPGTESSILGAVPPPQGQGTVGDDRPQGIPTPTFNENK